ncbi:diphthine synthase, partial [Candidatus Parvarchaeota archaeon]|nr:diphthine synthase [Candidatus Parvarchaeota archaeon]
MLYLIGTGLFYLNDLPLRAVDVLKSADKVFLERYTNVTDVSYLGELEKTIGKKIEILERQKVEDEYLVKLASGS